MEIQLKILSHQTNCLKALIKVFDKVEITTNNPIYQNPIINLNDYNIYKNIESIQNGEVEDVNSIPRLMRRRVDDNILGIDAKLETGTGKTYIYTRFMYELHKLHGFNKFILLVPSTPIKEGTKNFIEADYSKKHFGDLYQAKIKLEVLNAQKSKKSGRKMFPSSIADFARGTRLEKKYINVLLMSDSMLLSKKTMDKDDYDQTLLGSYNQPYQALEETRPIVIIDEPHRFRRENKAYQCIVEKLRPQCIIRFGATFPDINKSKEKDYNNLVYNLGACEAFNEGLVKGVAVQTLQDTNEENTRIRLMDISNRSPKSCILRNEQNKKRYTLSIGDFLSNVDESFNGIMIDMIGKTENTDIKTGVTLSNGQIISKGDIIFSSIYSATYQELMLKQAIDNHFKQEKENFFRSNKIKTLTLFFIDSVYSYRGEENDGSLRLKFEELLGQKLQNEIKIIDTDSKLSKVKVEYRDYLVASLKDIKKTNGGYFAEDNSKSDEEIQKEVDNILRDKEALLSFHDVDGKWNTMRFVFSKWTLREGWDNPNVFQIAKLRSSGSEISKLQEVGRGLRLPVDEYGNRIDCEQFYLTYLVDFSEKSFAENLVCEINNDTIQVSNIKVMLGKVARERGIEENKLFAQLLIDGYVDPEMNIIADKRDEMMNKYPEFNTGVQSDKIIDETKVKRGIVKIRKDRFNEIKNLWERINQKYYIKLDDISDAEILEAVKDILKTDIYESQVIYATQEKTQLDSRGYIGIEKETVGYHEINEGMPYNKFLKQVHCATGLPLIIVHKAFVERNKVKKLQDDFFNSATLTNFVLKFQEWLETAFLKRFSYRRLDVYSKETTLTDIDGNVKNSIIQGNIGIMRDDSLKVPTKFLFDSFVYDSPKERENIEHSDIDEVVVFGKIPRRSIKIPLYFGGTTSPDFMYVLKKQKGAYVVNLIVETKDVNKNSGLRSEENMRIESARAFFEAMQDSGVNVKFEKQMKSDDIVKMIKKMIK